MTFHTNFSELYKSKFEKIFPLKKKVLEQLSTAHSIPILIFKRKEKLDLFYNLGGGIK